ncbi:MAG: hypothetical protein IJP46_00895 [Prevotella sp.]|nr:hypothetical protein [Prevotella sp.]
MKRTIIFTALCLLFFLTASAQQEVKRFQGNFVNEELEIYMRLNLYDSMPIPDHDLFGPLPGYLAKRHNGFYWLIISAEVKNEKRATVQFVNDYGSEDLEATLTVPNDSTLILQQREGSTIKVPRNGKWSKLPAKITFKRTAQLPY